jgi:hypothetical protein
MTRRRNSRTQPESCVTPQLSIRNRAVKWDLHPSKLDDTTAFLGSAVEDESRPQVEAVAELRAALNRYEAALRVRAEAQVAGRFAAALGRPVPEMADRSEARDVFVAAMEILARCADLDAEPRTFAEHREHEAEGNDNGAHVSEEVGALSEPESAAPSRVRLTTKRVRELEVLRGLVRHAGDAAEPASDADVIRELRALEEITADTTNWTLLSTPLQQLWLTYLNARTRALGDRVQQNDHPLMKRLRHVIWQLNEFSRVTRPGHINGMQQQHEPVGVSWATDARVLLGDLRELAFPERGDVEDLLRPSPDKVKAR